MFHFCSIQKKDHVSYIKYQQGHQELKVSMNSKWPNTGTDQYISTFYIKTPLKCKKHLCYEKTLIFYVPRAAGRPDLPSRTRRTPTAPPQPPPPPPRPVSPHYWCGCEMLAQYIIYSIMCPPAFSPFIVWIGDGTMRAEAGAMRRGMIPSGHASYCSLNNKPKLQKFK